METAGAAKRHQNVIARVVASLDGDDANRFLHHCVRDFQDSAGKLFDRAKRAALLFHQPARQFLREGNQFLPTKWGTATDLFEHPI